jgi:hypothetical protein
LEYPSRCTVRHYGWTSFGFQHSPPDTEEIHTQLEGMTGNSTIVAGIEIPSRDPAFLAVVGVHVLLGLVCKVTGALGMLNAKRPFMPTMAHEGIMGRWDRTYFSYAAPPGGVLRR